MSKKISMKQKSIVFRNARINYHISAGEHPAVMLIHGFGEDGSIWEHQVSYLKEKFRLIVPDIPGSGHSDHMEVSGPESRILEEYAEALQQILLHENITRCTLIGHSMGGYIALAFLSLYNRYVNGTGFIHSTIFADSEERKEMRKKGIAFIQRFGAHEFLKQSIPNLFTDAFVAQHPEVVEKLIYKSWQFSPDSLVQYYRAMAARPDCTELMKNYRKPVLFIIGEEDKSVYLQDSLKQCHIPSVSHIKILPGVAHMGMWEAKNQVSTSLEEYLNYVVDG